MIKIGLTTFHEHGSLLNKDKLTLEEYASFFPIIELDTLFYGIRSADISQGWVDRTPSNFQFILKAYQGMTRHRSFDDYYTDEKEMFEAYQTFIQPLKKANKLSSILFQFPSFFKCNQENVAYLRKIRDYYQDEPISIEFRNSSWYHEEVLSSTISFMKQYNYSMVIVDEPQVPRHSVPFDTTVTNDSFAFVRLHGRNQGNWLDTSENWRKKRNLYCYSERELEKLAKDLGSINASEIAVIFNNNSDKDAAPNGIELKKILDVEYEGLNPSQTSLF